MRIIPTLGWRLAGDPGEAVDPRLLPLLEAISTSTSLAAAVAACGVSYRAAWGLLRDYERTFGVPLVRLERGRGASLTALGMQWLEAQATARERLARMLPASRSRSPVRRPRRARPARRVTVAASHDLALAALAEALPAAGVAIDLSVMGSLNALREFGEGRADIAGFHVPIDASAGAERAPFLRWLHARRDKLVRFVDREQGLILPRGNPAHVRSLRDVADRNLRFVNRQRGSGTRLLIDRMIADEQHRRLGPRGLRQRGVHASGGGGDGRLRRRGRRIRASRRRRRIRARVRPAGAGALLPRDSRQGRGHADLRPPDRSAEERRFRAARAPLARLSRRSRGLDRRRRGAGAASRRRRRRLPSQARLLAQAARRRRDTPRRSAAGRYAASTRMPSTSIRAAFGSAAT